MGGWSVAHVQATNWYYLPDLINILEFVFHVILSCWRLEVSSQIDLGIDLFYFVEERASGVKNQAENVTEKMTDDDKEYDEKQSRAPNPKHYQLTEAGLWWDSFEEDPQFEICDDFDEQLTLDEGEDHVGHNVLSR